ncbi:unnamed protein product [Caenorhabditis angaria]|uniref:RRM domain-containing protein n=1 Tax=Caenorhabditis angaria TaxID=860376 RepID=A0A9P1IN92_9PELO|nr:unnamed protein product [Caenorhabditis angaria]
MGKRKLAEVAKPEYQAGGLATLFGVSSDSAVIQEEVVQGASTIEKPKRRKFEKKPAENSEEPVENPEKPAPKTDRAKQRENRTKSKTAKRSLTEDNAKTIFVGNMPLTATEKSVRKLFAEFGQIDSVRLRNVIPKNAKISKRIAHLTGKFSEKQTSLTFYVKFVDAESVEKSLKLNGTKIEEHTIRVDKCGQKKEFGKDLAVFVGNLPFDISEDALHDFFTAQIGPVDAVRIVRDKETGQGKGFAFVNFKDDSSTSLALSMEKIEMEKREIRITKVMKKGQINKISNAKKKNANANNKKAAATKDAKKLENFKFSTKKERSTEQNERRALKKSAKKAINKKKLAKKGRIMQ